jgi:hypothetical protein
MTEEQVVGRAKDEGCMVVERRSTSWRIGKRAERRANILAEIERRRGQNSTCTLLLLAYSGRSTRSRTRARTQPVQANLTTEETFDVDDELLQFADEFDEEEPTKPEPPLKKQCNGTQIEARAKFEKEYNEGDEDEDLNVMCSICFKKFSLPVETCCGHTFCAHCLSKINSSSCPLCRRKLGNWEEIRLHQGVDCETLILPKMCKRIFSFDRTVVALRNRFVEKMLKSSQ